jgi:hypothetical protein
MEFSDFLIIQQQQLVPALAREKKWRALSVFAQKLPRTLFSLSLCCCDDVDTLSPHMKSQKTTNAAACLLAVDDDNLTM